MHVISFRTLRELAETAPDAAERLRAWHKIADSSEWENIAEVRRQYPHADSVGRCTIFNIRGGHYRLVVQIVYELQLIYVKKVMTHAEYDVDRGKRWKKSCDC